VQSPGPSHDQTPPSVWSFAQTQFGLAFFQSPAPHAEQTTASRQTSPTREHTLPNASAGQVLPSGFVDPSGTTRSATDPSFGPFCEAPVSPPQAAAVPINRTPMTRTRVVIGSVARRALRLERRASLGESSCMEWLWCKFGSPQDGPVTLRGAGAPRRCKSRGNDLDRETSVGIERCSGVAPHVWTSLPISRRDKCRRGMDARARSVPWHDTEVSLGGPCRDDRLPYPARHRA
jgi:hypothetical protein